MYTYALVSTQKIAVVPPSSKSHDEETPRQTEQGSKKSRAEYNVKNLAQQLTVTKTESEVSWGFHL